MESLQFVSFFPTSQRRTRFVLGTWNLTNKINITSDFLNHSLFLQFLPSISSPIYYRHYHSLKL
ncbi:unnamed protein product [Schistosoma rodhaini]|nr:unnamed protein product [Schistosoma rodhaini]